MCRLICRSRFYYKLNSSQAFQPAFTSMAPMKAMNAKEMTKGGITEDYPHDTELKKNICGKILNSLACNTGGTENLSVYHI